MLMHINRCAVMNVLTLNKSLRYIFKIQNNLMWTKRYDLHFYWLSMPDCRTVVSCACHFYPLLTVLWIREISALLSIEHYLKNFYDNNFHVLSSVNCFASSPRLGRSEPRNHSATAVHVFRALYVQKWIWIQLSANNIA